MSKSIKIEIGWTSNDKKTDTNEKTEKMSFEISATIPIQGVPLTPKIGGETGSKKLTEIMSSMQMEYKRTDDTTWESHDKQRDVFSIVIQGECLSGSCPSRQPPFLLVATPFISCQMNAQQCLYPNALCPPSPASCVTQARSTRTPTSCTCTLNL